MEWWSDGMGEWWSDGVMEWGSDGMGRERNWEFCVFLCLLWLFSYFLILPLFTLLARVNSQFLCAFSQFLIPNS